MGLIFILIGVICEVIATLLGFSVFTGAHYFGWLALGLVFFMAASLVGPVVALRRD
jgi:hypothetical protein